MRYSLSILFFLLLGPNLIGQVKRDGKVTYITSQHVYVKFNSMEDLVAGDTLYIKRGDKDVPALKIKNLSSISCVCTPLISDAFKVSDDVFASLKIKITPEAADLSITNEPEQKKLVESEVAAESKMFEPIAAFSAVVNAALSSITSILTVATCEVIAWYTSSNDSLTVVGLPKVES